MTGQQMHGVSALPLPIALAPNGGSGLVKRQKRYLVMMRWTARLLEFNCCLISAISSYSCLKKILRSKLFQAMSWLVGCSNWKTAHGRSSAAGVHLRHRNSPGCCDRSISSPTRSASTLARPELSKGIDAPSSKRRSSATFHRFAKRHFQTIFLFLLEIPPILPSQPAENQGFEPDFEPSQEGGCDGSKNPEKPRIAAGCDVVSAENGESREKKEKKPYLNGEDRISPRRPRGAYAKDIKAYAAANPNLEVEKIAKHFGCSRVRVERILGAPHAE